MSNSDLSTMDFVRELRLRQWARQHFVAPESRKASWHPVVLDEMSRRDRELRNEAPPRNIDVEIAMAETLPQQSDLNGAQIEDLSQHAGSVFVPLEPTTSW